MVIKKNPLPGPCYLKLLVNNFVAGSVIGKSGSIINQIEQETGCVLKLSPSQSFFPGTQDRIVVMSGKQDEVNRALLVILGKIRDYTIQHNGPVGSSGVVGSSGNGNLGSNGTLSPNATHAGTGNIGLSGSMKLTAKIVLPKTCVSAIIGKGGQQIKDLQETTGARIQISNREDGYGLEERVVTLTGSFESLQGAALTICATVQSDPTLKDNMYLDYSKINNNVAAAAAAAAAVAFGNPLGSMMGGGGVGGNVGAGAGGGLGIGGSAAAGGHIGAYGNSAQFLPPPYAAAYHHLQQAHHHGQPGQMLPPNSSIGMTAHGGSGGGGSGGVGGGAAGAGSGVGVGAGGGGGEVMCHPCEIVMQIPDKIVGPIIGKNGMCLTEIIQYSGARVQISQKGDIIPGTDDRKCVISGTVASVHMAHIMMLQRKMLAESQVKPTMATLATGVVAHLSAVPTIQVPL